MFHFFLRSRFLLVSAVLAFFAVNTLFGDDWEDITKKASGQTVYFHAWAGSPQINAYINDKAEVLKERYNITLEHIKINDIAVTIQKIYSEKNAGKTAEGSVDLVWINGENFAFMKTNALLFGPYTQRLPNYALIDASNPSFFKDFNETVDNLEAPWGTARFVFIYDNEAVDNPPRSAIELLKFAENNPGRFSYPPPPNFHGTTFLKQLLLEVTPDQQVLYRPYTKAAFDKVTPALWDFLDKLHASSWGKGDKFPKDLSNMINMFDNRELSLIFSFNPSEARAGFLAGTMPESARTYVFKNGTIGNAHFLGIPFNSSAKEAAMVAVNYFLSAEAQADKANNTIWGDPTVLDPALLTPAEKAFFDKNDSGVQGFQPPKGDTVLSEIHSSWVQPLENEWKSRYFK